MNPRIDDFSDLEEAAMANQNRLKKWCFDEITKRLAWLLDEAAGGKGFNDYSPEDHDMETRAYIDDLYKALELIMKIAGYTLSPKELITNLIKREDYEDDPDIPF